MHAQGRAAWTTAGATVVLVLVTIVSVVFTGRMMKAASQNVEIAEHSARHSAKAANVAEEAARQSARAADTAERALLAESMPPLVIAAYNRDKGETVDHHIRMANVGRSPARNVVVRYLSEEQRLSVVRRIAKVS